MLVLVGLALVTGWWDQAVTWLQVHLVTAPRWQCERPRMSDLRRTSPRDGRRWQPSGDRDHHRRAGRAEPPGSSLRWAWRQLTSMRTALVLLLLLALGAIPGLGHPAERRRRAEDRRTGRRPTRTLTPIYERLGLFAVYDSPWFSAIYLLLMVSLVGCIVPRLVRLLARAPAPPPAAPRNLTRLPDHAAYTHRRGAGRRARARRAGACCARGRYRVLADRAEDGWVSAERG